MRETMSGGEVMSPESSCTFDRAYLPLACERAANDLRTGCSRVPEAMTDGDGVPMGKRRIEIHEDQHYRWWWALHDGERVAVHGPYDTKRDAKHDAHARAPHVHVATIPWKLP